MRIFKPAAAALLLSLAAVTVAADGAGMAVVASPHDVATTADRLERVLGEKGMKVFARIDHAAGAASAGLELRPTVLVIFGNPQVGTKLMQCGQSAAIDLPMKALVWRDAEGRVWLGYNTPEYLAQRHSLAGCEAVLEKVRGALAAFAAAATAP